MLVKHELRRKILSRVPGVAGYSLHEGANEGKSRRNPGLGGPVMKTKTKLHAGSHTGPFDLSVFGT